MIESSEVDTSSSVAATSQFEVRARNVDAAMTVSSVHMNFQVDGEQFAALSDVDLTIHPSEFVCLVGPSGCGKSTLLMLMAGLMQPSSGRIEMGGKIVDKPSPSRGVVFQEGGVMPWRNVLENVTFGLELQKIGSRAERVEKARHFINMVGLSPFEGRLPKELSGGMRQRLAIAQSLACDPELLLLDEPFGALDAITRESMQISLLEIWQAQRKSVCFVTHSVDEAVLLADRILIMASNPGRIVEEVIVPFDRPRTADIRDTEAFQHLKESIRRTINDYSGGPAA